MDGQRAGQVRGRLRQYWLLPPFAGRQRSWMLHPLKTARQIILFVAICFGLDALGAYTLPWGWISMIADALSVVVAFAVVEVAYRRWWQPANQSPPAQTLRS